MSAITVLSAALAVVAVVAHQGRTVLVPRAREASAMVPLPGGGLLFGERETGIVAAADAGGRVDGDPVDVLPVSADGQRGVLGLARDTSGRVFAAYTDTRRRLVVVHIGEGARRVVWLGPETADAGNGGRIAFSGDDTLLIGVGDMQTPALVGDPDAPNGKLLALDPDGSASQRPRVVSSGWNNPFAFVVTPAGRVWVADNAPGDVPERLARGDSAAPSRVTELPGRTAPSGLAASSERDLYVCGYVSRLLWRFRVAQDGRAVRVGDPLARDCRLGVVALTDGTIAYATETRIKRVN